MLKELCHGVVIDLPDLKKINFSLKEPQNNSFLM